MKTPKVSVIMAEYNTPPNYLKRAISSILQQSYQDFEFVIIDDRGETGVSQFVRTFHDQRIIVLKNEKNMGLVYSLNRAIESARGKYLVRMDTDDYSMPERISKLVSFIENHPQYSVVGSKAIEFSGEKIMGSVGSAGEKTKINIVSGDSPVHASVIMKKEDIQAVGGYPNYQRAEDLALWCELVLREYRIFVIDEDLYQYHVAPSDYDKRKLSKRKGEIQARLYYNKKLKAGLKGYLRVLKSIASASLPVAFVKLYRRWFVLKDS